MGISEKRARELLGDPMASFRGIRGVRQPVKERRRDWNDVPASELRHSSGKEGSKLTADRVYPSSPKKSHAQAHAETVQRGSFSPLKTGEAKRNEAADAAWDRNAKRLRERGW
jgi:hypothetical protein